ncbi:uncharacterized protein [Cherax quadricarinatus]
MAATLSRSWSFFNTRHSTRTKNYLSQDYQPSTPGSRVNLQERFRQEEGCQRRTSLPPPPPTHNNTFTHHQHCPKAKGSCQITPNISCLDKENCSKNNNQEESCYNEPCECLSSSTNFPPNHPHKSQDGSNNHTSGSHRSFHPLSSLPHRPLRKLPSGIAPLWNNIHDNVSQLKPQTSRFFNEGGRRMNRALQGVRTSFSSFTQMFRNSTRRRYRLDGGTPTRTPRRTPGKLYTPFDISTPATPNSYTKGPKRLQNATARRNINGNENRGVIRTPKHSASAPTSSRQWAHFHSPSQSLQRDMAAVNRGLKDLEHVRSGILHNGREKWIQFC